MLKYIINTIDSKKMDESTLTNSENDSFYSKDTTITISDTESVDLDKSTMSLPKLITSIANVLNEIIQENKHNTSFIKKDFFFSRRIPSISLEEYIKRIVSYSNIEISTLISSVIYIDRLCEANNYILCNNNIHRIVLCSILASTKMNEDNHGNNGYFSRIGGIGNGEMNALEYAFYSYLNYELYIQPENYAKYDKYFRSCQNKPIS